MIRQLIIIVGLPGSGKTCYGNALAKETGFYYLDDCKDPESLCDAVRKHDKVIVSSPWFVIQNAQDIIISEAKRIDADILEWIFFENDPIQCLINVKNRDDRRIVDGFIKSNTKQYNIPKIENHKNMKIVKVYKKEKDAKETTI